MFDPSLFCVVFLVKLLFSFFADFRFWVALITAVLGPMALTIIERFADLTDLKIFPVLRVIAIEIIKGVNRPDLAIQRVHPFIGRVFGLKNFPRFFGDRLQYLRVWVLI